MMLIYIMFTFTTFNQLVSTSKNLELPYKNAGKLWVTKD